MTTTQKGYACDFQDIHLHIMLYGKFWYTKTDSPVDDIRRMIANWSGTDIKFISPTDAYRLVIETAFALVPNWKLYNYMYHWFDDLNSYVMFGGKRRRYSMRYQDFVQELLSLFGITKIDELPEGVVFPEASDKYLPLSHPKQENPEAIATK